MPRSRVGVHVRGPAVSLPLGGYGTSRLVVAAAVSFYARDPQRRPELGTDLALQRVRRGDLPAAFPSRAST